MTARGHGAVGASPDVLIVGGGVIGCAAAYACTKAGLRVMLVERERIGAGASSAAAGLLAPQVEAFQPDDFFQFGLAGRAEHAPLSAQLLDELGMDVEYRASGVLRVALEEREAADLRGRVSWQLQRGLKVEWLEPDEVARREPLFAGAAGKLLVGALWLPEESQTRPPRLVQALAATAARAGADIVEGTPVIELLHAGSRVTGVRIPGGDIAAGTVVLAAGAWSSPLLAPVLPVAVEPIKGQILSLGSVGIAPRHVTWAGHCYIAPKSDGEVIVGATEERAGYDTRPTLSGLAQLATEATTVMPALGRLPVLRQWAGLRPATADRLPVIGAVPGWSGLFVATAHFRNGVLLGPLTGKVIAAAIQGKPAPFDVTPYSPARFVN